MRVTHVITRLIVGGAQENTIASVLGLRAKPGWELDLISGPTAGREGSLEHLFDACPGVFHLQPHLVRQVSPWQDLLGLLQLTAWFRAHRPLIVHTHSGKAGILGRLAAARAKVPLIIHTIHGPSFGPFQGPLANTVFRTAERLAVKVTTHFVVVANAMRDQYLTAGIGTPEQYTRIFSGFDLNPYLHATNDPALRASLGLQPSDIVVGKIARLFDLKGHDALFAVAPGLVQANPRLKFLLVGDGPLRERFETAARSCGLQDRFIFTGLVPPERVPALVGIMDILVHLSLREGLPRALPQALACARPVIAVDCDGAREVCLHNQTGYLLPPGDRAALQEHLLKLAGDPGLRAALGRAGQELVRRHFDTVTMVDAIDRLYRDLIRSSSLRLDTIAPAS